MSQDFLIRPATDADVPLLGDIDVRSGALFPAGRIPDPAEGIAQDLLLSGLQQGLLLVCEVEQQVVGFALCELTSESLHLAQLSVLPDYGRRGIGRAMLGEVAALARQQGASQVTLTTFSDLPWNGPFYASFGFVELPRNALSAMLQQHIQREESAGMFHRVAMRYELTEA